MIHIEKIDAAHKQDINIPNEPFSLWGRVVPSYQDEKWSYELIQFQEDEVSTMCFPDYPYDFEEMSRDTVFLGAYDDGTCIGVAVLQEGFFAYLYLLDLKVNQAYRGQHVGKKLMEKAAEIAREKNYRGIYTQGQDNNPGACLFYLHNGFVIGGLDTNVYKGTKQEGKADIIFYWDC